MAANRFPASFSFAMPNSFAPTLRDLRFLFYAVALVAGLAALYLGANAALSRIPVAKLDPNAAPDVPVFLRSNGVHTDLVLPVHHPQMDWSQQLHYADTQANDSSFEYVGIGWGDKGFYLDTPTWADLKFVTAVRAGFWLSTTAMHTTFYHAADLRPGPATVALHLSHAEYARLLAYIQASFQRDAAGKVRPISGHSYGRNDAFYEANDTYSLFHTCNSWTNDGLKVAGQKACYWTALETGIFRQYGQSGKPVNNDH